MQPALQPSAQWQQRLDSYRPENNQLWEVAQAYHQLVGLMDEWHLHENLQGPMNMLERVHALTPEEMQQIRRHVIAHSEDPRYAHLAHQFAKPRSNLDTVNAPDNFTETGNPDVVAFDNIDPAYPVHKLVVPANKRYMSFEHFVTEAPADEIGRYFKSVLRVAQQAVRHYDETLPPEKAAQRQYFEEAFARMRANYHPGKKPDPAEVEIIRKYITNRDGIAVRDPRTGNSGFRLLINCMPGAAAMSQPHLHTQVLGGCFIQRWQNITNDPDRVDAHAKRLYSSLCI